ncbi:MAG: FAD-dependent oxidoreductase [Coriobacteriales bacterium]|jgi:succinate dehydrogenase/fumarate reductase flavoprotein subunit|nr:FAD-dependent oxidoreductase [Coriobacteriales bacterium]
MKQSGKSQKEGISRRSFLTGAAAAGALTVAGLAGCAPSTPGTNEKDSTSTNAASTGYSWEKAPTPITNFAETIDTEILVIGAGISGLCCACAAAESGAKVIVAEKCGNFNGRGGGFGAINSRYMEAVGATFDKTDAYAHWIAQTGSRSTETLIAKFFRDSERASNWMLDKIDAVGGAVMVGDFFSKDKVWAEVPGYHMAFLMPDPANPDAPPLFDYNPFLPATLAHADAVKAGAEFIFNAPAVQLIKEGDKVVGAVIQTDEKTYKRINASKGVVLATGDISGDPEMVEAYAPIALPYPLERTQYTPTSVMAGWNNGTAVNNGEGHKMGLWVGGQMVDLPGPTMMHPQAFTWFHAAFLFVNINGERFFCEDTWVQGKSNNMVRQPEQRAFAIFDDNWLEDIANTVDHGGGMFWDSFRPFGSPTTAAAESFRAQMFEGDPMSGSTSWLEAGKAPDAATDPVTWTQPAWQADTIEELAELIHVPATTLKATVDRYNTLCDAGSDTDFFKEAVFLTPIKKAPFYATKVGPAVLTIPTGLKCDDNFAVLDADGKPIDGLYVTGNIAGSVIAVDYPINVAGNSHGRCITFGYDLGKQLAGDYEPALKPGDPMPGLKLGTSNAWTAEGFPAAT